MGMGNNLGNKMYNHTDHNMGMDNNTGNSMDNTYENNTNDVTDPEMKQHIPQNNSTGSNISELTARNHTGQPVDPDHSIKNSTEKVQYDDKTSKGSADLGQDIAKIIANKTFYGKLAVL